MDRFGRFCYVFLMKTAAYAHLPRYVYVRKGYTYFERAGHRCRRLRADPGTPEFDAEYRAALQGLDVAALDRDPVQDAHFAMMESQAKKRARKYGREYTLPPGWGKEQYARQDGKCALSGMFMGKDRAKHAPHAPSIDRRDSRKGYTTENCRLVTYIVNCAKNQFTERELLEMCRSLIAHNYPASPV